MQAKSITLNRTQVINFWLRVSPESPGCWIWHGPCNALGYGRFRDMLAHRIAWTLLVGPIPDELTLDHLCRNPRCVNPDHLEPVTQRTNTQRIPKYKRQG